MYAQPQHVPVDAGIDDDLNEMLVHERGWPDVASGLTRILLGWGVLVGGMGGGIALVILSMFMSKPAMFWAFFIGLAAVGTCGIFSWWTILSGLLKCLLGSPERGGVRWCIYVCMLCLAIGPILNIASCFLCSTEKPDFDKGVDGLRKIKLDPTGRFIQAMCMVGTVGYNIAFILFLRSIGCCFRSLLVVRLSDVYLLLYLGMLGTIGYLIFFKLAWVMRHPEIILPIGAGGLVLFVMYITLLILARTCIGANITKVRTTMGQTVFATA
jgi:hypothetical protein